MFTERKIEKFKQTISALPDTPNVSAAELKRRFDACPEELRQALNGVCDDGAALEKRMDAYRAETFEGEITRDMLAPAVREELSGKAEQTALDVLAKTVSQKCEVILGTYTGDGKATQNIILGFQPRALFSTNDEGRDGMGSYKYGGLAFPGMPSTSCTITENGFTVNNSDSGNNRGEIYKYIALK